MAPSISLPDTSLLADPERLLALSYAPAERRAALAALWRLDERMGTIVATAREPAIGAMRLLWWRDALTGLDTPGAMPPAEPLLGEMMLLGAVPEDAGRAGEGWALADLGHRLSDPAARHFAREQAADRLEEVAVGRWPAALRPLGLLATFARGDAAMPAARLRRQGSPKRLFRGLAYRLTGR